MVTHFTELVNTAKLYVFYLSPCQRWCW